MCAVSVRTFYELSTQISSTEIWKQNAQRTVEVWSLVIQPEPHGLNCKQTKQHCIITYGSIGKLYSVPDFQTYLTNSRQQNGEFLWKHWKHIFFTNFVKATAFANSSENSLFCWKSAIFQGLLPLQILQKTAHFAEKQLFFSDYCLCKFSENSSFCGFSKTFADSPNCGFSKTFADSPKGLRILQEACGFSFFTLKKGG